MAGFHEALDDLLECFRQFEEWLPGCLGTVMEFLVQIPEGDELDLYRLADLRLELTNLVAEYQMQVGPLGVDVMTTFQGGQGSGAEGYRAKYTRHMKVAASASESSASLAEMVQASGNSIEFMKLMALWDLYDLAMALFSAIMTLIASFGLSSIGVAAAYTITRHAIKEAADKLLHELAQHGAKAALHKVPELAADVAKAASPFVRTTGRAPIRDLPSKVGEMIVRTGRAPLNVARGLRHPGKALTEMGERLITHQAGQEALKEGGGRIARFAELNRIARTAPNATTARAMAIASRQARDDAARTAREAAETAFGRLTGKDKAAAIAKAGGKFVWEGTLEGAKGGLKEVGLSMAYMVAAGHQDSITLVDDQYGRPGLLNMTFEEAVTGGVSAGVTRGHHGTGVEAFGEGVGALTASGVTYSMSNPASLHDFLFGQGQGVTSAAQEAAFELIGGVRGHHAASVGGAEAQVLADFGNDSGPGTGSAAAPSASTAPSLSALVTSAAAGAPTVAGAPAAAGAPTAGAPVPASAGAPSAGAGSPSGGSAPGQAGGSTGSGNQGSGGSQGSSRSSGSPATTSAASSSSGGSSSGGSSSGGSSSGGSSSSAGPADAPRAEGPPADSQPASSQTASSLTASSQTVPSQVADSPSVDSRPADPPPTDSQPATEAPAAAPGSDTHPASAAPASDAPAVDAPPPDTPPADTPPADTPSVNTPPPDGGPTDLRSADITPSDPAPTDHLAPGPDTSAPNASGPDTTGPDPVNADTVNADTASTDTTAHDMTAHDAAAPDTTTPSHTTAHDGAAPDSDAAAVDTGTADSGTASSPDVPGADHAAPDTSDTTAPNDPAPAREERPIRPPVTGPAVSDVQLPSASAPTTAPAQPPPLTQQALDDALNGPARTPEQIRQREYLGSLARDGQSPDVPTVQAAVDDHHRAAVALLLAAGTAGTAAAVAARTARPTITPATLSAAPTTQPDLATTPASTDTPPPPGHTPTDPDPNQPDPNAPAPNAPAPDETGPHETGPHETGPKDLGPEEIGPQEIGPDKVRLDAVRPDAERPDEIGPTSADTDTDESPDPTGASAPADSVDTRDTGEADNPRDAGDPRHSSDTADADHASAPEADETPTVGNADDPSEPAHPGDASEPADPGNPSEPGDVGDTDASPTVGDPGDPASPDPHPGDPASPDPGPVDPAAALTDPDVLAELERESTQYFADVTQRIQRLQTWFDSLGPTVREITRLEQVARRASEDAINEANRLPGLSAAKTTTAGYAAHTAQVANDHIRAATDARARANALSRDAENLRDQASQARREFRLVRAYRLNLRARRAHDAAMSWYGRAGHVSLLADRAVQAARDAAARAQLATADLDAAQAARRDHMQKSRNATTQADSLRPPVNRQDRALNPNTYTDPDLAGLPTNWADQNTDWSDPDSETARPMAPGDPLVANPPAGVVNRPAADLFRPVDPHFGFRLPLLTHQRQLEAALLADFGGFPLHPRVDTGTWFQRLNAFGFTLDPARRINCTDARRAFVDTFLGRPRVAAPVVRSGYNDRSAENINHPGGPRGLDEDWTGGRYQEVVPFLQNSPPGSPATMQALQDGVNRIAAALWAAGDGAQAMIDTEWRGGGAHAWGAVNQGGTIFFVDPQTGRVQETLPFVNEIVFMDMIVLDPAGAPVPVTGLPISVRSERPPTPDYIRAAAKGPRPSVPPKNPAPITTGDANPNPTGPNPSNPNPADTDTADAADTADATNTADAAGGVDAADVAELAEPARIDAWRRESTAYHASLDERIDRLQAWFQELSAQQADVDAARDTAKRLADAADRAEAAGQDAQSLRAMADAEAARFAETEAAYKQALIRQHRATEPTFDPNDPALADTPTNWVDQNTDAGRLVTADDPVVQRRPVGRDVPPADQLRAYGRDGYRAPLLAHQRLLESALVTAFGRIPVHPEVNVGRWVERINDFGARFDTTRRLNCVDSVRSFVDTWYGRPRVAAPLARSRFRMRNAMRPIRADHSGADTPGMDEDWTGGRLQQVVPNVDRLDPDAADAAVRDGYARVATALRDAGPGALAMLSTSWRSGAAHTFTAVNQNGEVWWVDPQSGRVSPDPLWPESDLRELDLLLLGPDGSPVPVDGLPISPQSEREPTPEYEAAAAAPPDGPTPDGPTPHGRTPDDPTPDGATPSARDPRTGPADTAPAADPAPPVVGAPSSEAEARGLGPHGNDARKDGAHGDGAREDDAREDDAHGNGARGNDAPGNDAPGNDAPGNDASRDDAARERAAVQIRADQRLAEGLAGTVRSRVPLGRGVEGAPAAPPADHGVATRRAAREIVGALARPGGRFTSAQVRPDGVVRLSGDGPTVRVRIVTVASPEVVRATTGPQGLVTLAVSDRADRGALETALPLAIDRAAPSPEAPGPVPGPTGPAGVSAGAQAQLTSLIWTLDALDRAAGRPIARARVQARARAQIAAAGLAQSLDPADTEWARLRALLDPDVAARIAALDPLPEFGLASTAAARTRIAAGPRTPTGPATAVDAERAAVQSRERSLTAALRASTPSSAPAAAPGPRRAITVPAGAGHPGLGSGIGRPTGTGDGRGEAGSTDTGNAGPPTAGPGSAGPGNTGPGNTGPGNTGPGSTGPGSTGPGSTGPGSTGPGTGGPGSGAPVGNGAGGNVPGVGTGPGGIGPGGIGPSGSWPSGVGPGSVGPGGVGPGGVGLGGVGPGSVGPGSVGPGSVGPGSGGPGSGGPGSGGPGSGGPGGVGPGGVGPGGVGPGGPPPGSGPTPAGDPDGPLFHADGTLRAPAWIADVAGVARIEPVPGRPGLFAVHPTAAGPAFALALGVDPSLPPGTVRILPGAPPGALSVAVPPRGRRADTQVELAAVIAAFVATHTGAGPTDLLGSGPADRALQAARAPARFSADDHARLTRVRGYGRAAAEAAPILRGRAAERFQQAVLAAHLHPSGAVPGTTPTTPDDAALRLAAAVRTGLLTTADADAVAALGNQRPTPATRRVEDAVARAVAAFGGTSAPRGGGLVDLAPAGAPAVTARVVVGRTGGEAATVTRFVGGMTITVDPDADPTDAAKAAARWVAGALAAAANAPTAGSILTTDPLDGRSTLFVADHQARAELTELAQAVHEAGRFARRAAVATLARRAEELGLRAGARDAAGRRALLTAAAAGPDLAGLLDGRRATPGPLPTLTPDALAGADVHPDPTAPTVLVVTPHGAAPLRITLAQGPVPDGAIAVADPGTDLANGTATITVDPLADPVAARISLTGAVAELVAIAAGLPSGFPSVRTGGPTTDPLTVADARSLAEVRAALAESRTRGRNAPGSEVLEALGRELELLGPGDGPVVRRGRLDPATESALAARGDAEPAALTRARQQVEAAAARFPGATATRLDASRLRLTGAGTDVTLTVRIGASTRLTTGPTLVVYPGADPLALDRLVARSVATELAARNGLPAGVTSDDVANAAELSVLARQASDPAIGRRNRRAAARAVVALRAAADLDPRRPGGERRYERLRAEGLIDPDGHTALAALLDPADVEARRNARDAMVRAAEGAGAARVTPVGDGLAEVALPDGTTFTIEVADGTDVPSTRIDADVLTVFRPPASRADLVAGTHTNGPVVLTTDHGPSDLVTLATGVATEVATRLGLRTDEPVLRPGPPVRPDPAAAPGTALVPAANALTPDDHGATDIGAVAGLRHALAAAPADARRLIAELGLTSGTLGAFERRASLPADVRTGVERLDPTGTPAAVATGLAAAVDALRTSGTDVSGTAASVDPDPSRPNVLLVRFPHPAAPTDRSRDLTVEVGVYRDPDPHAAPVRFLDDPVRGLAIVVNPRASDVALRHAVTVALTRWTRRQLTPEMPAGWGPERLTLPLDPSRWTPAHYARVASLRFLLGRLKAAETVPGHLVFRDAVLRSRIRQLSGQLGLDRGVGRAVSRLDLLREHGLLTESEAAAMLDVDRPGALRPVRRADERRHDETLAAARAAIEQLHGEHGIASLTWNEVSWAPGFGTFDVTLTNGRSFALEVVAGSLVSSEAADGPIDPSGRLASVVVNHRRPLSVRPAEWRRRLQREAVAQTVAIAARQPAAGVPAATTAPADRTVRRGTASPPATPIGPDDHVTLARLTRWVRQYGALSPGSFDARRVGRQLDEQLTALGMDADAPGVDGLRAHLPADVRATLERHDGHRRTADAGAVAARARLALQNAARLAGVTFDVTPSGVYEIGGLRVVVGPHTTPGTGSGVVLTPGTPTVLTLSPWLDDGQVDLAVARVVGELTTAVPRDPTTGGMVLRVAALADRIATTRNPIDRARLRRQFRELTRGYRLDRDSPGVDVRRAFFAGHPDVLDELRRTDDLSRPAQPDLTAVHAELRRAAADAGIADVRADAADPTLVTLTLADGSTHTVAIGSRAGLDGRIAAGHFDTVLGHPVLRLDTRATGLPRQAAVVRELARIAAQLDRVARGLSPDATPMFRPGQRTAPIRPADLAPADWALAAEGRFLARTHADASRAARRWIERRADVLAQTAGALDGEPGGAQRRAALPAEFGTLLTTLDGSPIGARTRVAEAALLALADELGLPVSRIGRDPLAPATMRDGQPRYLVTMPDGQQVRVRIFVDSLGPGVVARADTQTMSDGTDLITLDVEETASPDRIRAAVTGELATRLSDGLSARRPGWRGHRLGVPDPVTNDLTAQQLSAARFGALTELRTLDRIADPASGHDSRRAQRRAARAARDLVTRLGLAAGAEDAPALRAALPADLREIVRRYDGSRPEPNRYAAFDTAADAVRAVARFRRLDDGTRLRVQNEGDVLVVDGPAGAPLRITLATAPPPGSGLAPLGDGQAAAIHRLGPDEALLLVSPSTPDAVLEDAVVRAAGRLIADLRPPLTTPSAADPAVVATVRNLAGRIGPLHRATARTALRRYLAEQGLAADQPGADTRRADLPGDLRRMLERLDGDLPADANRVVETLVYTAPSLAADTDVERVRVTPYGGGWHQVTVDVTKNGGELTFVVGADSLPSGVTTAVDPSGRVLVSDTASPERVQAAIAREIGRRLAEQRQTANAGPATPPSVNDKLTIGPLSAGELSPTDHGEIAYLRTVARLSGSVRTPSAWFAETATRLGLHSGQVDAVAKAALVVANEQDVLHRRFSRLDDPISLAERNRYTPGFPTGVPAPRTYIGKAYASTGTALLVASLVSSARGRLDQALLSLGLAATVPGTAGYGEWVTRHRSRRTADANELAKRAKDQVSREKISDQETATASMLAALTAAAEQLGVPLPQTPDVRAPVRGDRLDLRANPLPYRRARSAVLPTRSYLRKTAPAPLLYGSLIGYVAASIGVFSPAAAGITGAAAGLFGSIGEWIKYRGQEREQDRDDDRQHDRDFETKVPEDTATADRLLRQRELAATLRDQLRQLAAQENIPLPAPAGGPAGPRRTVDDQLLVDEDLARWSLRTELPSLTEHLVKSGTSGVGLGTAMQVSALVGVSALTGNPLPLAVLWAGLAGGGIGTVVGGASESRMQYHWDRLRRERERDEGELAAHAATDRSADYAAVIDDLAESYRIIAAFGDALGTPALTADPPDPVEPVPATPTKRAGGAPNWKKALDRAYFPRTVPAMIVHVTVGVPAALLLHAVPSLVPGLVGRVAAVFGAYGDKWADGAEKDRAADRQAPHRDRMAQVTNAQVAQRVNTERMAEDLKRRLARLDLALEARRQAAHQGAAPNPPDPNSP